jgi:hypothetical protein
MVKKINSLKDLKGLNNVYTYIILGLVIVLAALIFFNWGYLSGLFNSDDASISTNLSSDDLENNLSDVSDINNATNLTIQKNVTVYTYNYRAGSGGGSGSSGPVNQDPVINESENNQTTNETNQTLVGQICTDLMNGTQNVQGSVSGDDRYNSTYDINKNGGINIQDIILIRNNNYNETWCSTFFVIDNNQTGNETLVIGPICTDLMNKTQEVQGSRLGDIRYNSTFDINKNGGINIQDIILITNNQYNETWCSNIFFVVDNNQTSNNQTGNETLELN